MSISKLTSEVPGRKRLTSKEYDDLVLDIRAIDQPANSTVNIKTFGAIGDGVADDTAAIKSAIAASMCVHIPEGTYLHDGTITVPTGRKICGCGVGATILKVKDNAPANAWGLKILSAQDVRISDLSVHGNPKRLTKPYSFSGGPFGSGIIVQNSERVYIDHVNSVDWAKHCFDVSANAYGSPDKDTYLEDGRSKHVYIDSCYASGGGDDNFTTHQSDYIRISNCFSENPSGNYIPNNTNCFEIDDGSRHVQLLNVFARGGACGIQVKGHDTSPAPQDVLVNGAHIWDCNYGLDAYNTSMYGNGSDIDDGSYSKTAKNLTIKNIFISNPTVARDTGEELPFALRVRSYANVVIDNVHIMNSVEALHDDALVHLNSGVRNVSVSNIVFEGCSNFDMAVYLTFTTRKVNVRGVVAMHCTGKTSNAVLVRYTDEDTTTVSGVRFLESTNLTTLRDSDRNFSPSIGSNEISRVQTQSKSNGGIGATTTTTISHGWVEGGIDLGADEGTTWEMTCQLSGESEPTPVVQMSSRKSSGSDTSKSHEFILGTHDGSVGIVERVRYLTTGQVKFGGQVIQKLGANTTLTENGQMAFYQTNDTTLTVKVVGSDGVVRSATLTLA